MGSPQVIVGLSALDGSKQSNTRVAASAVDITAEGFTMVIKTWSDTLIWAANVSWTALGY